MLQQRAGFQPLPNHLFEAVRCRVLSQGAGMRRREFIAGLAGTVAAWPLAGRAQQGERARRIGILMDLAGDDPEGQARVAAFTQGLQESGWAIGRNARIDIRWAAGDVERTRRFAAE